MNTKIWFNLALVSMIAASGTVSTVAFGSDSSSATATGQTSNVACSGMTDTEYKAYLEALRKAADAKKAGKAG